jgi:hypothetical protein
MHALRQTVLRLGLAALTALVLPQKVLAQGPDTPSGGSFPIPFYVFGTLFDWRPPALCAYEGQLIPCSVVKKMILHSKMVAAGHPKVCRGLLGDPPGCPNVHLPGLQPAPTDSTTTAMSIADPEACYNDATERGATIEEAAAACGVPIVRAQTIQLEANTQLPVIAMQAAAVAPGHPSQCLASPALEAGTFGSQLGGFISEDPIGFGGGIDFCAFVGNDPVNLTDPRGLQGPIRSVPVCPPGTPCIGPAPSSTSNRRLPCTPRFHWDNYLSCVESRLMEGGTYAVLGACLGAGKQFGATAAYVCSFTPIIAARVQCEKFAWFCDEEGPGEYPDFNKSSAGRPPYLPPPGPTGPWP